MSSAAVVIGALRVNNQRTWGIYKSIYTKLDRFFFLFFFWSWLCSINFIDFGIVFNQEGKLKTEIVRLNTGFYGVVANFQTSKIGEFISPAEVALVCFKFILSFIKCCSLITE